MIYTSLLAQFRSGQTEFDSYPHPHEGRHVAVLAVFDHDWEQHLLVQQCSTGPVARLLGMDSWEFALYHVTGDIVTHRWDESLALVPVAGRELTKALAAYARAIRRTVRETGRT